MDDGFATGFIAGQNDGGNNNGGFFGNEGLWAVIILAIIFGWGNNRNGNGGGDSNMSYLPYIMGAGGQGGADTRAAISDGFAMNNLSSDVRAVQNGLCDGFYTLSNTVQNGFHGVDNAICQLGYNNAQLANNTNIALMQGFNGVQAGQTALSTQLASCCCENKQLIGDLKYTMAEQDCQTRQAIADAARSIIDVNNANYRGLMDYFTQDKIASLQAENQTLKFAASQQAQNAYIAANQEAQTAELIRRLGRDNPVPAYVVPNPNCCYGNPLGVTYGGQGCGGYNNQSCGCC